MGGLKLIHGRCLLRLLLANTGLDWNLLASCAREEAAPVGQFPHTGHVAILLLSHEQLVGTHPSLFDWKHMLVCLTSARAQTCLHLFTV